MVRNWSNRIDGSPHNEVVGAVDIDAVDHGAASGRTKVLWGKCALCSSRRIAVRRYHRRTMPQIARYLRAKSPTTHRNYLRAENQTDVRRDVFTSINRSRRARTLVWNPHAIFSEAT